MCSITHYLEENDEQLNVAQSVQFDIFLRNHA